MGATPGNLQLMSRHVAIVTDSTAYLPQRTMERHGITAVPLTVVLGDQALEEGTEISTRSLAQALQKRRPVTTSRPSPQLFAETYRKVAQPPMRASCAGSGLPPSYRIDSGLLQECSSL